MILKVGDIDIKNSWDIKKEEVADVGYWKGMRYYQDGGTFVEIDDTFAEMFPMWAGRVLVTAEEKVALH